MTTDRAGHGARSTARPAAVRRALGVLAVTVVASLAVLAWPVPPAAAQTPAQVRDGIERGVYAEEGTANRVPLEATVERARAAGIELVVVVAPNPQPDVHAFALRVRQLGVGDPVLVVGPGVLGFSGEDIPRSDLARARAAAEANSETLEGAVDAFVEALLTEPERDVPGLISDLTVVVALAVAVLGAAVILEQATQAGRRRRREDRAAGH